MKKILSLFTVFTLILFLSACSGEEESNNYIERAKLLKEEDEILELLVGDNDYNIYDFKIDRDVKTLQTDLKELKDGKWEFVSGDLTQFKDETGRIALSFENFGEGLRVAIQSKNSSGYSSYATELVEEINKDLITITESTLEEREDIIYEKEIPIIIQTLSYEDSVISYSMDSFFTPEVYEEENYEHIYAVTVMFSKKTIDELTEDKDK